MMKKVAVIQFPGSNCDRDAYHAFKDSLKLHTEVVWHKERDLSAFDVAIVPGGFSFGDYLRCGAIARFSPVMETLREFSASGRLVLGICNGFQILCEAGLLPGALVRNNCLEFRCETVRLKVEDSTGTIRPDRLQPILRLPIAHGEGNYRIDEGGLAELEANRQIILRYCDAEGRATDAANPNGSIANIAGIRNREGNVFGLMPHPERAVERIHPSTDGADFLRAFLDTKIEVAV